MPEALTVEQRLVALESEVALLKKHLEEKSEPKMDWIQQITGSMEGKAGFEEMVRLGAEIRRADRPEEVGS